MFELNGLSVTFPLGSALRDISLKIAPGDRLGIVGESGSGKSLLASCLMGMAPDAATLSGTLTIDGVDMSHADEETWRPLRARRVAMIFQEPMSALNPLRRVGDTVAEPLRLHFGLSGDEAAKRVVELFAEVDLPNPERRARMFPHELSGGQRQRVLIALALACDPALLIADAPTTALDANVALQVTDLLVDLSEKRGMALVLISHDLASVARSTERIAVKYGGDIVERGETEAVLHAPQHPYTQGLLAARPDPQAALRDEHGKRKRLPTIPGNVPPLSGLAEGCRFAGRCVLELPTCATTRPAEAGPRRVMCPVVELPS